MVAFPLAKFVYLGMKQISGPIARQLKVVARRSPFVSKYICSPPAQGKNCVQRRLMNLCNLKDNFFFK